MLCCYCCVHKIPSWFFRGRPAIQADRSDIKSWHKKSVFFFVVSSCFFHRLNKNNCFKHLEEFQLEDKRTNERPSRYCSSTFNSAAMVSERHRSGQPCVTAAHQHQHIYLIHLQDRFQLLCTFLLLLWGGEANSPQWWWNKWHIWAASDFTWLQISLFLSTQKSDAHQESWYWAADRMTALQCLNQYALH